MTLLVAAISGPSRSHVVWAEGRVHALVKFDHEANVVLKERFGGRAVARRHWCAGAVTLRLVFFSRGLLLPEARPCKRGSRSCLRFGVDSRVIGFDPVPGVAKMIL